MTSSDHPRRQERQPLSWSGAGGLAAALTGVVVILFLAFAWPAANTAPRDVPVGVAAPAPAAAQVETALAGGAEGAFEVTRYDSAELLREAVLDREVYGGVVVASTGPAVVVATGGSPAVAQLLEQVAVGLSAQTGTDVPVEDLAPLPDEDPRGVGLAASALPLTLAGLLPAYAFVLLVPRRLGVRLAGVTVTAALTGLSVAAVLVWGLGSVATGFWLVAGGLGLGAAALSITLVGLHAAGGMRALLVGALTAVLLGNPLSGITSAPELLPSGWGTLGQLLPPGANATLLRSTAYFDGAGAGTAVLVLSAWLAVGLLLVAWAAWRRPRAERQKDRTAQDVRTQRAPSAAPDVPRSREGETAAGPVSGRA